MKLILRAICCFVVIGFSGTGFAQSLAELRPQFLEGCQAQGNEAPICACIYDNWSKDVPSEQVPLIPTAIDMMLGKMPQNTSDMMAATELVQGMTTVLLACASGSLPVESTPAFAPIPQTGDLVEEQLLYERVTNPGGTIEEMNRYTALVEARKAVERAAEQAAIAAQEQQAVENTAALKAAYNRELDRIHSRDINDWAPDEFENLFGLYCRSGGGTEESCSCAWPILRALSTFNAVPYMASRNEGDDIGQRLKPADRDAAPFSLSLFSERRAVCDS